MKTRKEIVQILNKFRVYIDKHGTSVTGKELTARQTKGINEKIDLYVHKDFILLFYDCSIGKTGKRGILFTEEKLAFKEMISKNHVLYYSDIADIMFEEDPKNKTYGTIKFILNDGSIVVYTESVISMPPLFACILDILG